MAAALLRSMVGDVEGEPVRVHSAGLMPGGMPATDQAQAAVAGLADHVSRQLEPALVEQADLVVGMARAHVREAAVLVPGAFARSFTLRELVRRGLAAGPRRPGEPVAAWLARVGAGRRASDLLGDDPDDDVADPIGLPLDAYRSTADELRSLLSSLAMLLGAGQAGT
jgi:protein-tyrosine phosphatase